jgi:transcriptional regulator with XRE-family HTH domain
MKFNEKLYQLRKEHKLSQEDLAEIIGVSRQAVQKWESGLSNPDIDNLVIISNYFKVTLDSLIRDNQEATTTSQETTNDQETINQGKTINEYFSHMFRPHYEYVSKRKLFGLPLVHINVGWGLYKAKGVFAIGNVAIGVISLGILSMGLIAFGTLALGLLVFAGLGLGGIVFAGIAAGILAIGGVAVGIFSIGGVAVGVYASGGVAIASRIAAGGVANGHIAIGDKVTGSITLITSGNSQITPEQVKQLILQEYPKILKPVLQYFVIFSK